MNGRMSTFSILLPKRSKHKSENVHRFTVQCPKKQGKELTTRGARTFCAPNEQRDYERWSERAHKRTGEPGNSS